MATSPTAKNIHLNPHGGNVGIGTGQTAPETKLHVNSGTGNRVAKFESTDATAYIQVADSNTTNSVHGYGANGDELSIYANGAERIRVDSDGRVAIGNSNPTDKLHVESSENGGVQIQVDNPNTGNASYAGLYLNGQGNNFFLKNWGDAVSGKSNGTEFLSTAGSSFFMFSTANAEKMRLTATGDLRINTTAPDSKLHIAEDAFDQTIVKLNFSSADSSAGNYAHFGEIRLAGHSTNCNTAIRSYSNAFQNSDGALAFWTQEHGGSFDERMRILGDGKIGIGTASPSFKVDILEASGNGLRIKAGDETADVALSVGSAGTADKFVIQAGGNVGVGTSSPALSLHVAGAMRVDSTDGIAARIIRSSYFSSSQNLELASGASANIILTTSKVGIGTTSPDYPLSVTGAARFRVDSSSTVFGNHAASIRLQNKNTTDNNYAGITFDGSTNTAGAIQFQYTDQSGSYGDITFESRSASGFSEKMRIKSTGEVGIGTTDPDTAKLVVQGADAGDMLHLHGLTGTDTRGLKISLSNEGATNQVVNYDSLQANG